MSNGGDVRRGLGVGLGVGLLGESPTDGRRGAPPIVLLHAFPLDSRMWIPLKDELARRGVVAHGFDYPGFGVTPLWDDAEPSIEAIADAAVVTLRDGIGVAVAHWVGCSMGGYVALAIAERHPDAVAGLGLVDTRSTADDETKRQGRLRSAAETEGLDRLPDPRGSAEALIGLEGKARGPVVEVAERIIGSAKPAAVAWGQRAMAARPDRTGALSGFDRPAVVVWGERDTMSDLGEAETMAAALGIPVTRIPGAGHLSPLEAPSALADALAPLR